MRPVAVRRTVGPVIRKRTILLVVAALLCAAALFALAVLLFGSFTRTEGRIIGTTALLGGYALVGYPAVALREHRRATLLAAATGVLAVLGAAAATTAVWWPGSVTGRLAGTTLAVALAFAQFSLLHARRRDGDGRLIASLYASSIVTGSVLASMFVYLIWANPDSTAYARAVGSAAVLDALAVALQPVLGRLQPRSEHYRLCLELDDHETPVADIEAPDLAAAAATAIRDAERAGRHVVGLRLER